MSQTKGEQVGFQDHNYLRDSLLIEILLRLPLKPIFKFKTVCKHLFSLISDPFFADSYVSRINNDLLLFPSKPWVLMMDYDPSQDHKPESIADVIAVNEYPKFISAGFSLSFLLIEPEGEWHLKQEIRYREVRRSAYASLRKQSLLGTSMLTLPTPLAIHPFNSDAMVVLQFLTIFRHKRRKQPVSENSCRMCICTALLSHVIIASYNA
ncbi:unnamed protein product [Dovyalis caffra]|uniref:F-box domain-containing protein n=1 Tax=Dovyalis caffra TaxID=77055 RepID=A0AAV1R5C1_9ROSI|nr:unnamed protein product [Dovyalis caffra]